MGEGNQQTYLGHSSINNKLSRVHEAALVTGKEQDCLSLFDSLAEPASWEMDLTTVSLCCVITKPVLEEWRAVVDVSYLLL